METMTAATPQAPAPPTASRARSRSRSRPPSTTRSRSRSAQRAKAPPSSGSDAPSNPAGPPTRPRPGRYGREPRDGTAGSVNWRTYTSVDDKSNKIGKRCYRLNLERPFDIHCEQSPLEYGDYMTPWDKSVYPPTVGPVDYCPPRHLGGNRAVWRELMRYAGPESGADAEEKVGSADMLETDLHLETAPVEDPASPPSAEGRDDDDVAADSGEMAESIEDPPATPVEDAEGEEETKADDYVEPAGNPKSPTNGWRELTPEQVSNIESLKEKDGNGEYTFATYDTAHESPEELEANQNARESARRERHERVDSRDELHTCLSNESEGADLRSSEEKADETARLFRRSELALREKAAKEAEEARLKAEEEKRLKEERKALERSQSGKGMGSKRRFSTKKLVRGMSKMMSSSGSSSSDWASQRRASTGSVGSRKPSSSMQAATIDKARDLVDESDDEGDAIPGDLDANGKPKNVSLYVLGEFDALNDLVNDGAKRLRENKTGSDLDVLLQNKPCPPPDRWVAVTGWSRCAPTSVYAKLPPADFDWVRYGDTTRTKTYPRGDVRGKPVNGPEDEAKVGASPAPGHFNKPAAPAAVVADKGPRPANPAVPTESMSGGSSPASEPAPPAPVVKTSWTGASTKKKVNPSGGAHSHFNKPAAAVDASAGDKKKSSRFGRKLSMGKK